MASQDFVIIEHSDANSQNGQESVQNITEWLAPTEYSSEGSEFRKHVGAHVPGTGNWIFSTLQFEKWSQSEDVGTLWIKGIPGSGKSVVAANLIKAFLEKGNHPVLYFFFRHIVDSNSKPIFLVRDFLAQLLPHSTQLASQLKRLMTNFPDIETAPIKDLWDALLTSLAIPTQVFIIVDALDEVQVGQEAFITDSLLKMNCMRPQAIKLMITSRPLPSFEKPSETAHTAILRLSGKLVDLDILAYISHRLDSQQQRHLNQEEISSIKGRSCGKEHGLFLQTRLMLDEVLRSNEPIQSLLERSMRSMSETYQSLLREHAIRAAVSEELQLQVLGWVVHASRPLRLLELAGVLSLQGPFADIPSAKRVLRICCGPLLEVLENETIQIIHHSFTEFLLDDARTKESQGGFPVLYSTRVHKRLASECLDYMLKAFAAHDFDLKWGGDQEKKDFLLKFPFMQYSVQNWPSHVLKSNIADDQVFEKLDNLLSSGGRDFGIWLHLNPDAYKPLLLGSEAIHVSSFLGLKAYAEYLLQRGANANSNGPGGCTPLMFAAMRGYADMIDILVAYGGDFNARDSLGLTAMHMAAAFNHGRAVQALARCGSELLPCQTDTKGGIGTPEWRPYNPIPTPRQRKTPSFWNSENKIGIEITPIRFACEFGCSDSVTALLQCMDSVQRATVRLQWAAYIGHAEILSILLRYPEVARNIDQADDSGDTPLIIASREKWPEAVRVLLEAGANISARSENVAELEHRMGFVAFDRKRRRTQNSCGKTALEAWAEPCTSSVQDSDALLENMDTVATLLIRAGCDVDVRSADGSTPLSRWSAQSQAQ